LKSLELSR